MEPLRLRATYAGTEHVVEVAADATVGALKAAIEAATGCPAATQKLMYKGRLMKGRRCASFAPS
jgi:hypothetical protein